MSTKVKNRGRRRFLTGSVACGVGMLLPAERTSGAVPVVADEGCGVLALSDNLALYLRMVDTVMADVLSRKIIRDAKLIDKYIDAQVRLNDLVKELAAELEKSAPMAGEAERLKELSEACVATAKLFKAPIGTATPDTTPLPAAIAAMQAQICDRAQRLLPNEEVKLSGYALKLLRAIICLITCKEFVEISQRVTSGNTFSQDANTVITRFSDLRSAITNARLSVMKIEDGCSTEDKGPARASAERYLNNAVLKLREIIQSETNNKKKDKQAGSPDNSVDLDNRAYLVSGPFTRLSHTFVAELPELPAGETDIFEMSESESTAPPVDTLLLNIIGASRAVRTLGPLPLPAGVSCSGDGIKPQATSFVRTSWGEPAAVQNLYASIVGVLVRHCGPGTPDRANECKKIVQGVRMVGWLLSETNRRRMIRGSLAMSDPVRGFACPRGGTLDSLASGLTPLTRWV